MVEAGSLALPVPCLEEEDVRGYLANSTSQDGSQEEEDDSDFGSSFGLKGRE